MEIKVEIVENDIEAINWLDMRFNPLEDDDHFWIPVRDRTNVITTIELLK